MARFPLNFNAIEDKQFPVYPPGLYTLRITEARQEPAKSSGELKETIKYEIVQGPGTSVEFAGKTLLTSYTLQQAGGFRLQKLLAACNIPKEQMADVDDQQLVGCVIQAQLAVDTYLGKQNNKVSNESPTTAPGAATSAAPAQTFPTPAGFGAPPAAAGAPAAAPAFAPPAWGAPTANGNPAAPAPPPAKPAGS